MAAEILYSKWLGVCLVKESLDAMLKIGGMGPTIQWLQFVAIAAGHLCPVSIFFMVYFLKYLYFCSKVRVVRFCLNMNVLSVFCLTAMMAIHS